MTHIHDKKMRILTYCDLVYVFLEGFSNLERDIFDENEIAVYHNGRCIC